MDRKPIDAAELAGAWVHSHEEDTPTTAVYRPATYAFPPARGRTGFRLAPDGRLSTRTPGPADETVTADGTWRLAAGALELAPAGGPARTLPVESVGPDRLVVRKK